MKGRKMMLVNKSNKCDEDRGNSYAVTNNDGMPITSDVIHLISRVGMGTPLNETARRAAAGTTSQTKCVFSNSARYQGELHK